MAINDKFLEDSSLVKQFQRKYHLSEPVQLATFNPEYVKYFHTDKIVDYLKPTTTSDIVKNHFPFISYRLFLINPRNQILFKDSSPLNASWKGIIPFSESFSYDYVEKCINDDITIHFSHCKKTNGRFFDLTYYHLAFQREMIYFYVMLIDFNDGNIDIHSVPDKHVKYNRKETYHFLNVSAFQQRLLNSEASEHEFDDENSLIIKKLSKLPSAEELLHDSTTIKTQNPSKSTLPLSSIDYYSIGAIVGRFQPLHKGHAQLLFTMLENHYKIKIGIGSSQYERTKENPFSYDERKQMIINTMDDQNIKSSRYSVYPIPDLHNYEKWGNKVMEILEPFDLFYSNSPWTRQIMSEHGKSCAPLLKYDFDKYNGSHIRKLMTHHDSFADLVPKPVYEFLQRLVIFS